jgi:hypothetical protein
MEIKDNELLRQFETNVDEELVAIEYSIQERKIFLTKYCFSDNTTAETKEEFLKKVLDIAEERNLKVVPTNIEIIKFFRKNRRYQQMLPPGLKI